MQRTFFNLGMGIGGLAGGLIAVSSSPRTFTTLFVVDAATFVAHVGVLAFLTAPHAADGAGARPQGRWADVLVDRPLLGLLGLNFVYVLAGYTLFEVALPLFAKNQAGTTSGRSRSCSSPTR